MFFFLAFLPQKELENNVYNVECLFPCTFRLGFSSAIISGGAYKEHSIFYNHSYTSWKECGEKLEVKPFPSHTLSFF